MADAVPLHCDCCKKTFTTAEFAIGHFQSKKHLIKENDVDFAVYIEGFDPAQNREDIWRYFSKFGAKKKQYFNPNLNYLTLQFENEEQVKKVISTSHFFMGKKLRLIKCLPKSQNGHDAELEDELNSKLLESLKDSANFDDQVRRFLLAATPAPHEAARTYNAVNQDVYRAVCPLFPSCYIFNFGSSTAGLQFKTSDLDIYIEIGNFTGNYRRCLRDIKMALIRSGQFANVIEIPMAKVPIVKAVHKRTSTKCDINFKTIVGVENSKAIRFFLSLDPKLRPAMLIVKYWGKVREISGKNHLFTSYSMVMMFVFYLQRCHAFPSVRQLQRNTAPSNPRVLWNLNLNPAGNIGEIQGLRSKSLKEILKGFFEYYKTFDFDSNVICPYLGKTVEKKCFSDLSTVPDEFDIYKANIEVVSPLSYEKPVCLQDPFEHDTNTCRGILDNVLREFVQECSIAFDVMSSDDENLLLRLFTWNPPPVKHKKDKADPACYSFVLKKPEDVKFLGQDSKEWFQHVLDYCSEVFEKVLRLDMKPKTNNKSARVGKQQDVHDLDKIKMYTAEAYVNMWDRRNSRPPEIVDRLNACETTLERDVTLSEYFWEENFKVKPNTPLFVVDIVVTFLKGNSGVKVELVRVKSYKKMFKAFATYVTNKMPQWFEKHTKELNEKHGKSSGDED